MLIDIIAGCYSDFIKIAPIIGVIKKEQRNGTSIGYRLIYSGTQEELDRYGDFLTELNISTPNILLNSNSAKDIEHAATVLARYGKLLQNNSPDVTLVTGHSTAAMSCALAASKTEEVLIAHMEAGIRSGDRSNKDEVNRIVSDSVSDYFFTTSRVANENLRSSSIPEEHIFFVGNTVIDTLNKQVNYFKQPKAWNTLKLQPQQFCLLSLQHNQYATDSEELKKILLNVIRTSRNIPIVFVMTPGISKNYQSLGIRAHNLFPINDIDYWEKGFLAHRAKVVVTDDNILQINSTALHVPCISLQHDDLIYETALSGSCEVVKNNHDEILNVFNLLFDNNWKKSHVPYLWDGKTAERIIAVLKNVLD